MSKDPERWIYVKCEIVETSKVIREIRNIYRLWAGGGLAERPRRGILACFWLLLTFLIILELQLNRSLGFLQFYKQLFADEMLHN